MKRKLWTLVMATVGVISAAGSLQRPAVRAFDCLANGSQCSSGGQCCNLSCCCSATSCTCRACV